MFFYKQKNKFKKVGTDNKTVPILIKKYVVSINGVGKW